MERAPGRSYLLWMLAIVGAYVLLNIDTMWSWSVDLAHHYALAFRISEHWTLAASSDPTLGEMNHYPRGSHVIAAMVGVLLNSTFLGIHVTALASLALLWMCAILVLNSLPGRMAVISLATLTALIVVNALTTKFEFHGHELVENYFFAQLVGHSILFASITLAIKLERRLGAIWSTSALAILMLLNAAVHLLPAIEMLGLILALLFVYVLLERRPKHSILQRIVLAAPIALLSTGTLLLHPSFDAMRSIAENNGGLELHNVPYPIGLIVLCIVVIITSLKLFLHWFRSTDGNETPAVKYVAIYGGVAAALCLLQYTLTFLGHGSAYAVKKYGFGLTSILLLQVSMIVSAYVCSWRQAVTPSTGSGASLLRPLVLVPPFVAVLFLNLPSKKTLDVSDIVLLERRLINLADTLLPTPEDNRSNVVIGLSDLPTTIDYLFSIAIAKTPRNLAIPDILRRSDLADPSDYSYIVVPRESQKFASAGCESVAKGSLSIISARCLEERMPAASYCRQAFNFSLDGTIPPTLLKGFSSPEPHGRWSDGEYASFECITGDLPVKALTLEVTPFIHGSLKSQGIEVTVNGRVMYEEKLSTARDRENPIFIKIPASMKSSRYILEFRFPDAKSPKDVGYNDDTRRLGFSFQRIIFE